MNLYSKLSQQIAEVLTEHYRYEHGDCDDNCSHIQGEMATRAHCIYMILKIPGLAPHEGDDLATRRDDGITERD